MIVAQGGGQGGAGPAYEPVGEDVEAEALALSLRDLAKQVIHLMPELPREAASLIDSIQEPGSLADLVAANLDAPVDEKSMLMSTIDVKDRIRLVLKLLTRQLEILKMRERINSQIKEEMGKNQREYVLRQQLKAIKEELGEDEGDQQGQRTWAHECSGTKTQRGMSTVRVCDWPLRRTCTSMRDACDRPATAAPMRDGSVTGTTPCSW